MKQTESNKIINITGEDPKLTIINQSKGITQASFLVVVSFVAFLIMAIVSIVEFQNGCSWMLIYDVILSIFLALIFILNFNKLPNQ